ncbi:hypothetical protein ABZW32_11925 [Streptomyces sp. NPDC004667]|uniref:hypothetical protein n=1 Tax=Streptomyces sp. NPDC004667 TaxID=3154285 RepID=UPI00339E1190
MRIVIEDVPDHLGAEIALGIVELVARHTPLAYGGDGISVLVQCDWTPERAAHLLRDLPLRAIGVVRHVVEGSGWADVDTLRGANGDGLWKGFNTTLASAVARGARRGLWPAGIRVPLTPTTHPDGDRRIRGYAMPCEAVAVFARALESTESAAARGDVR